MVRRLIRAFMAALFPCLPGRSADLESADNLAWLGRLIARMHIVGARSRFEHRATLTPALARTALDAVIGGLLLPEHLGSRAREYGSQLTSRIEKLWADAGSCARLRLHGDLHRGNLLWNEGPLLVDFDDAVNGPAVQDLWMLLPVDDESALEALLEGYETFRPFDRSELALIPALRAIRRLHFAGWLSQRYADPAFPRAFPYAAGARFWEEEVNDWRELCSRKLRPKLAQMWVCGPMADLRRSLAAASRAAVRFFELALHWSWRRPPPPRTDPLARVTPEQCAAP